MGIFKTKCPFGVSTKRFAPVGYHPGLDPLGTLRKFGGIGPGHYKIKDIECGFKKKRIKERWTQKLELEDFSRTLGYKNAAILRTKQEAAKIRGPGYYDIPETIFRPCDHNVYKDVFFGTTKRFKKRIKNDNPGPGTYGVPHRKYEIKCKPVHQWTELPPFEWDGMVSRFKKHYRSWELPCNRYDVPNDGVEAVMAKVVSKRGPYDCFTGPRDNTTIKGYFAPPSFKGAKIWPRSLPGCFDYLIKSKTKSRTGQFFKAERFKEYVDLDIPGPNRYDMRSTKQVKPSLHPFNCSVTSVRPRARWSLQPGPGRYETKLPTCKMMVPHNYKETWQFKSRTQRTQYKAVVYNDF